MRNHSISPLAVWTVVALSPISPFPIQVLVAGGLVLVAGIGWRRGDKNATLSALFWTSFILASFLFSDVFGLPYSQLSFGFAVAVYAAAVWRIRWLKGGGAWLRRGRVDSTVVLLGGGSVVLAALALLTWFVWAKPDVSDILESYFPDVGLPQLLVGGLLFSMVNAALEEFAYRGLLMNSLQTATGSPRGALLLQAIAFGTLHFQHGFPRSWIGVGLATVYGLILGLVWNRSRGMLAPWVAHVLTDATIVGILLFVA